MAAKDFNSVGDIQVWLVDQPLHWIQAIACRASLRVLPLSPLNIDSDPDLDQAEKERRILTAFRTNYLCWVAMQYGHSPNKLATRILATSVNEAIRDIREIVETAERINLAVHHSMSAALSAAITTMISFAASRTGDAAEMAVRTLHEAMFATSNLAGGVNAEEASLLLMSSFLDDVSLLSSDAQEKQSNGNPLRDAPLWISDVRQEARYVVNFPLWARTNWDAFARKTKIPPKGFVPWINWYLDTLPKSRSRQPKSHFGPNIDIRIASQPSQWWTQEVTQIEKDIAAWRSKDIAPERKGTDDSADIERIASEVEMGRQDGVGEVISQTSFLPDWPVSEVDDLERSSMAFVLAGRINQIWNELNVEGATPSMRAPLPDLVWRIGQWWKHLKDQPMPGFVVHIDAPWGGGKSTFASFIAQILNPYGHPGLPPFWLRRLRLYGDAWPIEYRRPWHVVRFNAWQHQHVSPPWWVFYQAIRLQALRALSKEVLRVKPAPHVSYGSDEFIERTKAEFLIPQAPADRWRYECFLVRKLQVWWCWVCEVGWRLWTPAFFRKVIFASVALLVTAVALDFVYSSTTVLIAAPAVEASFKDLLAIFGSGLSVLVGGGTVIWQVVSAFASTLLSGTPDSAKNYALGSGDPLERFRRHFFRSMHRLRRPILVIVDDLDRCDPGYVVELIRGMQTILMSRRVIFLLLGDREWIQRSFSTAHEKMKTANMGDEHSFGARFVEKAIQLSFVLPSISHEVRLSYVQRLLGTHGGRQLVSSPGADHQELDRTSAAMYQELESVLAIPDAQERDKAAELLVERFHLEADNDLLREFNINLAQRAASDRTVEKAIRHHLEALASVLPANPRQIKRIINAISLTQEVARMAMNIQPGDQRWQVLALWIVLMVEWPKTWFTLSRFPDLVAKVFDDEWPGSSLPDEAITGELVKSIRENRAVMGILRFKSREEWWERSAIDIEAILWLREILPPTSGELLSSRSG